jgi:hypothetical protein
MLNNEEVTINCIAAMSDGTVGLVKDLYFKGDDYVAELETIDGQLIFDIPVETLTVEEL